jgi:RNA-directed DNA polymerase
VIRGWANYHQHAVAKKAFASMDHAIWENLWRWAKRRHPKKGLKWIREKYFSSIDGRQWVFA